MKQKIKGDKKVQEKNDTRRKKLKTEKKARQKMTQQLNLVQKLTHDRNSLEKQVTSCLLLESRNGGKITK